MMILMAIVAGLIATAGMTTFLWAVNRSGWAHADMVRAVGSLITKSYHNALGVGLIVHFISGMIIAAVYIYILGLLSLTSFATEVMMGGTMGFAQGFIVGLSIIRQSYRHPVEEFQKADYEVAIAHIIGHVIYGLLIGALYGVLRDLGVQFGF